MIDAEQTTRVDYRSNPTESEPRKRSGERARSAARRTGSADPALARQARRVSTAKRAERERRQRVLRARRTAAAIVALVFVIGCAWGGFALTRLPALNVTTVRVAGVRHLDAATVIRLAGVREGSSIVWLQKRRIATRIARNPWVESVSIDRDLPDTVRIDVAERVPAVAIDTGGARMWVVSTDGRWLGVRSAEESGVPVVRDIEVTQPKPGSIVASPEIKNVIRIVAGLSSELLGVTRLISAPSIQKTALITDDDVEVFVGDSSDIGKKDRIVREILKQEKGKVVYINVRVVDSPTWRGLDQ